MGENEKRVDDIIEAYRKGIADGSGMSQFHQQSHEPTPPKKKSEKFMSATVIALVSVAAIVLVIMILLRGDNLLLGGLNLPF